MFEIEHVYIIGDAILEEDFCIEMLKSFLVVELGSLLSLE